MRQIRVRVATRHRVRGLSLDDNVGFRRRRQRKSPRPLHLRRPRPLRLLPGPRRRRRERLSLGLSSTHPRVPLTTLPRTARHGPAGARARGGEEEGAPKLYGPVPGGAAILHPPTHARQARTPAPPPPPHLATTLAALLDFPCLYHASSRNPLSSSPPPPPPPHSHTHTACPFAVSFIANCFMPCASNELNTFYRPEPLHLNLRRLHAALACHLAFPTP